MLLAALVLTGCVDATAPSHPCITQVDTLIGWNRYHERPDTLIISTTVCWTYPPIGRPWS